MMLGLPTASMQGLRGMGTTVAPSGSPSLNSPAWANACGLSYLSWLTNWNCWGYSYDEWSAAFYATTGGTLTITTPVAPGTPSDLTTVPDTTGQTSQDLANAALAATQAANAAANQPNEYLPCAQSIAPLIPGLCDSYIYIGAAALIAVFVYGMVKK